MTKRLEPVKNNQDSAANAAAEGVVRERRVSETSNVQEVKGPDFTTFGERSEGPIIIDEEELARDFSQSFHMAALAREKAASDESGEDSAPDQSVFLHPTWNRHPMRRASDWK